jgi:drug/metabolite transporter (DMT)-like permease
VSASPRDFHDTGVVALVTWFPLSLSAALTQAAQFAVIKGRGQTIPAFVVVAWGQLLSALAWLAFFLLTGAPFAAPRWVWPAVVASSFLAVSMNALLARASARGDISIVGPMLALSPVFTLLPDAVLSGTVPSVLGWLGLGLTVIGTVSLSGGASWTERLRSLLGRRDALDALGAAVLLGMLGAVDRWAAMGIGPPSYLLCSHGTSGILSALLAGALVPRDLARSTAQANLITLLAYGLLGVTGTGMQTTALTMAPASYVNAIRRLSAVLSVVLGRTLFGEPDLRRRLLSALLASAGAACLLLAR